MGRLLMLEWLAFTQAEVESAPCHGEATPVTIAVDSDPFDVGLSVDKANESGYA